MCSCRTIVPVDRDDVVVPARPSSWLRRPPGLVARTRWLFCLCALVTLVLALSRPAMAGDGVSIIRTLPLDIVKLDKSFLSNGPSHAADEAVVAAIVQMAGSLGLCVIAEGVERPDQQRFLRSVGVDAAQGHLHLRPTPADRFGLWLQSRSDDVGAGRSRAGATVTPIGRRIG